jgi:hypothetical protein
VSCGAIELHDQLMVAPQSVDSHSADTRIYLGKREPGGRTELEEPFLEHAPRLGEPWHMCLEGRPQCLRPDPTAAQGLFEVAQLEQPAVIRLGQCSPELARAEHRGNVNQRPRQRGHRQVTTRRSIDPAGVVDPNCGQ